jgi:hypothetical protein
VDVIVICGFDFSSEEEVGLEEMVEFWSFCIFSSISNRVWRSRASSRASRSICLSFETRRSCSDPSILEICGLAVGLMGGAVYLANATSDRVKGLTSSYSQLFS